MRLLDLVRLARPIQWYKNLLVFVALVFVGALFDFASLGLSFLGFISLSLVSSAGYVVNDVLDRFSDRTNPEKRSRPVASGCVHVADALLFAWGLLSGGLFLAFALGLRFGISAVALSVIMLAYSSWLKREPVADVIVLGLGFVLRAVSGALLLDVRVSPWLVLCAFFLSLVLSLGKRVGERVYLGDAAVRHRAVLGVYAGRFADFLLIVSVASLVMSYSLFSFLSEHTGLFIALPLALYSVCRFAQLVYVGSPVARRPELVFGDARMLAAILLWAVLTGGALYLW